MPRNAPYHPAPPRIPRTAPYRPVHPRCTAITATCGSNLLGHEFRTTCRQRIYRSVLLPLLQETVARFLFQAASLIMDVGTGQAVGGGGQSVQCILQYIGLQPSVWKGQVAFAAVVATLTALMAAAKGPRVAVLVSINCFFPAFMCHFGRQLVCFRLGETEGREGLNCPHVPSFPGGFALVLAVTVLAAAVILRVWWSLYGGVAVEEAKKEESEEAKIPVHVAFLTAPYHEAYAKWETERLLRKTTFTLLAAMLPVSASPSLQMSSLGLLLLGSLVMYMLCLPYKNERRAV